MLYEVETPGAETTTRCAIGHVRSVLFIITAGGYQPWEWADVIILARLQEDRIREDNPAI
jgi:hypothetical protein